MDEAKGQIKASMPVGCNLCGATREELVELVGGSGFLTINIGIPGVIFFGCPRCNAVQTNPEAFANVKRIDEIRASNIVLPSGDSIRLVG